MFQVVGGSLFDESNFHHRLDALESVFPRNHHAHRRAILIRKRLAIHPHAKQRQGMHGLIDPQSFHIGKLNPRRRSAGICLASK